MYEEMLLVHVTCLYLFIIDLVNCQRTAICISGQIRTMLTEWKDLETDENFVKSITSNNNGTMRPVDTIIDNVLNPLQSTGFDVFMYIQTTGEGTKTEPLVGDNKACEELSNTKFFINDNILNPLNNSFFCLIEKQKQLMNPFIQSFKFWKDYPFHNYIMQEQLLTQLHGMYKCNEAIKSYSVSSNITYTYKMRLRPDSAVSQQIPRITTIDFSINEYSGKSTSDESSNQLNRACKSRILYSPIYSHEDWFNVGLASDMDKLLDRYLDFIGNPITNVILNHSWNAESFLIRLLRKEYHICLDSSDDFLVCIVRGQGGHQHNTWLPPSEPTWTKLYKNSIL